MSVQTNTYVMYGVVLPFKEVQEALKQRVADGEEAFDLYEPYLDNAFKEDFNPKDNVTVLSDGMSGRYFAIGHVIAKSDLYGCLNGDPITLNHPPQGFTTIDCYNVVQKLGLASVWVANGANAHWVVMTHYR